MDIPRHGDWDYTGQFRARCWQIAAAREVCGGFDTNRYVILGRLEERDIHADEKAVGLLVMMYPILCKVRYESLHRSFRQKTLWVQIGFSIVVNWIVAPFFMVKL